MAICIASSSAPGSMPSLNGYADDYLKSVDTEAEAIRLSEELRQCLAKGGFRLTKWVSNSQAVIDSIPESERASPVKHLDFEKSAHLQRPLGVQWNVTTDKFGFSISVKDRPLTRRGILSTVSSVYDPLGLAAPFVLPAKLILQDLCRKRLDWDERIPELEEKRYRTWLEDLPKLGQLEIDRCFKPRDFGEVVERQLHNFSDSSQVAYGAVTYLRIVNAHGDIHCSFVIGKSRLAPLKQLTIPRLELSAAVVATRLDTMIQRELEQPTTKESIYWTDSTCVIRYIENEDKRSQTFVANRVATIHEATTPAQWKYVDTSSNPADDASRGLTADSFINEQRWLQGPAFLWQPEETWPKRPDGMCNKIEDGDPEVKKTTTSFATVADPPGSVLTQTFERVSSWLRLKRSVAWMLRCKRKLKERVDAHKRGETLEFCSIDKITPLSTDEMKYAEKEILRQVQKESFPEELKGTSIKRKSPIYQLDPKLADGLLRVGGRLRHAPIDEDSKYPVILPKRHHVIDLIVRDCHEQSGHSGLEYVLSVARQRYWIVKARSTIRTVLNSCVHCKRRQAPFATQKMADLPEDRVTPNLPPFTNTGLDYFGPIEVKRGRGTAKRYGAIFTCLTTRAVHIEVANSLDTDSFINALRRFIARRGKPREIRSDNGSNLVRGEKELRDSIEEWNQQQIHSFLLQKQIKWKFSPPAGSHHGGVWKRCIRTVRKVLRAAAKEQTLDDEGLHTLMCEVESIVNGRPITKTSDDPKDCEALTPNHLLLLRSGPALPPAALNKQDLYSHKWRQVQDLADQFWRRWVREYLPSLQRRQKWNSASPNIAVGDLVLLEDDKTPRGTWPLGLIQEVYSNRSDGYVRRVKVKTAKSILERPITKIVLLESSSGANSDK